MGLAYSQACQTPQECRDAYAKLFAKWRTESIKRERDKQEIIRKYGGQPYPYSNPIPPYAHLCFPTELARTEKHLNNHNSWLQDIARIQMEIPKRCSMEEWRHKTSRKVAERVALEHAIEFCELRLNKPSIAVKVEDIVRDWQAGCHSTSSSCDTSLMTRGNELVIQQASSIPLSYSFKIELLVKQAFSLLGLTADGKPVAQSSLF